MVDSDYVYWFIPDGISPYCIIYCWGFAIFDKFYVVVPAKDECNTTVPFPQSVVCWDLKRALVKFSFVKPGQVLLYIFGPGFCY